MNPEIYLSTHRQQVAGRCHHLVEAIRLARERAGADWQDVAIWHGTELVAAVLADGSVRLLQGATWRPGPARAALAEPSGFLDLDALEAADGEPPL